MQFYAYKEGLFSTTYNIWLFPLNWIAYVAISPFALLPTHNIEDISTKRHLTIFFSLFPKKEIKAERRPQALPSKLVFLSCKKSLMKECLFSFSFCTCHTTTKVRKSYYMHLLLSRSWYVKHF